MARRKKNPAIKEILMSKGAYTVYGVAIGFAARTMIEGTAAGDLIDDTLGKLFGGAADTAAVAMGAIGMGGAHMGAVHMNPGHYGAIGMDMGAVGMDLGAVHMNPHSTQAEWAARNTIHSAMSRGGIL
jgi:hypothetical protein